MENGVIAFAEQPWVIAGVNPVRLPKQQMVEHDAKGMLSWALRPTVTWPVNMAARRLSEAKQVSTCATTLSFKKRLTAGHGLVLLLLLQAILSKIRRWLGLEREGLLL